MDLSEYGCSVPIWHIHGEAHKPNSMVMGHYYYGKLLREIENYLSGAMSRLKVLYKKEVNPIPTKSWVDLFLLGDVHIVGFSMSLSETDLWWLACCKKRNFPDSRIIYYKDHEENDPGKEEMTRTYGIEVVDMKGKVSDFKGYYEKSLNIIKDCIKQGRSI